MKSPEEIAYETWGEGTGFHPSLGPAVREMMVAAIEADRAQVTEEQVEAAGRVMYAHWDEWDGDDDHTQGNRQLVRTALEAAREAGR